MNMQEFTRQVQALECDSELVAFCQRKMINGLPMVFDGREDEYFLFRKRIADEHKIPYYEVHVIGSAKLGFSHINNTDFSLNSDIDVSIISTDLYNRLMDSIFRYQMRLRNFRKKVNDREIKQYHDFLEYTAMGWIRPDKLPISFQMDELKQNWFDFYKSISYGNSEVGNYKVSAGVFRNHECLEQYLANGLKSIFKLI